MSCPAGTGERGGPRVVAGGLAGTGQHSLGPDGLTAGLLAVERGGQLAGAGRAEVSAADRVAGGGGATGGAWVAQVVPEGAGREVSRAAGVGHIDRRRKDNCYLLDCGIYTLLAIGINNCEVIISTFLPPHLHDVLSIIISLRAAAYFPTQCSYAGCNNFHYNTKPVNYSCHKGMSLLYP